MELKFKIQRKEQDGLIGRRVRRRRLFLNMSQASLARSLGISFQLVQKYEQGKTLISLVRLREISHFLGVKPEYLLRGDQAGDSSHANALERFVESREGIKLNGAFARIRDANVRARVVAAIEVLSYGKQEPYAAEISGISSWLRKTSEGGAIAEHHDEAVIAIHTLKTELAQLIGQTLKTQKISQTFAAEILHTDQAKISAIARSNVRAVSFERLLRYVLLLGWSAHIKITKGSRSRRAAIKMTHDS